MEANCGTSLIAIFNKVNTPKEKEIYLAAEKLFKDMLKRYERRAPKMVKLLKYDLDHLGESAMENMNRAIYKKNPLYKYLMKKGK